MTPETPRRRATDDIDPVLELFVNEKIAEVRHVLRGELTTAVLGVTNKITELGNSIAARDLRASEDTARLEKKIGDLTVHDATNTAVATALEKQRTSMRTYALGLASLIVAIAIPVLLTVLK